MPAIHLPTRMRTFTKGKSTINIDGDNISNMLDNLVKGYPGIDEHLFDESNKIKSYTKVFLNDTDMDKLDGVNTKVDSRDTVYLITAMAGG